MTLRERLGAHGAAGVHERLEQLLDSDNAVIVLLDGERAHSYATGFALSPCQLELLALDIERTTRTVVGGPCAAARIQSEV